MAWWGRRAAERARQRLIQDVTDEVRRQAMDGGIPWLALDEVTIDAVTRAADEGCEGPDAIRALVAEVADGSRYEEARAAEARWAERGRERALRRWERERDQERKREKARAKAAEEAARRTQALEESVHRLLADAELTPGRAETTIAQLLIARDKEVSADRLRTAVEAYERAYERRVQRHRDSGGHTPWPTPDEVISSLFGPRA